MGLFQPPPRTNWDLNFVLFGIPVRVHPLFWLMALVLGGLSGDVLQIVIWIPLVFVSIVIHEMGHALTMRYYGMEAEVVLYWGGGLAVPREDRYGRRQPWLNTAQSIIISFAGPAAGFLFGGLVIVVVLIMGGTVIYEPLFNIIPAVTAFLPRYNVVTATVIADLLFFNIFWGAINLMPVLPLDGGNISRAYLTYTDPRGGEHLALWISVCVGAFLAVVGFVLMHSLFMALLFGWLALQSYQIVSATRFY